MANLIETDQMFYTPFEPKVQNRFILQVDGIPSFLCKKVSRPQIDCGEVIINHINVIRKHKGICKWGDITITMYDAIVPSGAQAVMEWVRLHHESATGRDGYSSFYKKQIQLHQLSPLGEVIEEWTLNGAFITDAAFGTFDWASDAVQEIELTIRYDWAFLNF